MAADPPVPRQRRGLGRVTLEDVAQAAGVTSITVSRFLREPALVALTTAERVRAALRETGYVPNKQAGQLASGRSKLAAALVPSLTQSPYAGAVQGLSDALQAAGFDLLLGSTGHSGEREEDLLRELLGWFPSAVVLAGGAHAEGTLKLLRSARNAGTAVVEIWDAGANGSDDFVRIGLDHGAVGRAMAAHLLERGHRRLAYVDGGAHDPCAALRGSGFAAAAQAAGAEVQRLPAPEGDAFEAGRQVLATLLTADASAACFAHDALACGALLEAGARHVEVPQRLALLGFGDEPAARQLTPALSTVSAPRDEIGRAAAQALLDTLGGAATAARTLPWQLVARAST